MPHGDHVAARFVAGDDPLVGLSALAFVLAVDRPQVAAADRGARGRTSTWPGPGSGSVTTRMDTLLPPGR